MNKVIHKSRFLLLIIILPAFLSISLDRGKVLAEENSSMASVYLPNILVNFPPEIPSFGTQVTPDRIHEVIDLMTEADLRWLRLNGINWDTIEPNRTNPPTYLWNSQMENKIKKASSNGLQVIATLRYTPSWAQGDPPYACGPIRQDALPAYAQYLNAMVRRYSQPPYNIRYWELGNEPDIDPDLGLDEHNPYGCWGDEDDDYYGGGYYAEMLKVAYPAIKAADPTAQVLIGGLLLNCDPTEETDCEPAKFFEGILRNEGGNFFDIVSFHGYPPFSSNLGGGLYYDEHHWNWASRGGVVLGKIDFLREVMATYSLNKPIMHTEGSLICPDCETPSAEFLEAQADYVVWLYVRNIAAGVKSTIWYQFDGPGWRFGGMLDENQEPKRAYWALDFLTEELAGASYKSPVVQYPTLRGFEFRNSQNRIWVLWSPDGESYTIDLPSGVQKVLDKYGVDITPSASEISVKSPIYVEILP